MTRAIRIVSLLAVLSLVLLAIPFLPAHLAGAPLPSDVWVAPPPMGNDGNPGTEAQPFATIQCGIDHVADSGTVHVAAGTYHEHGLHLSETMNLVGAGALITIIDGGANGYVIEVSSAPFQRNTISGFTIQNGAPSGSDAGGGIYISQAHIVTIDDCAIINNIKGGGTGPLPNMGGGICNDGGVLYMNRCTVSGNTASARGGGIYTNKTFGGDSGLAVLTNCTISENIVTESDGQGGGIWNSGTLTINKCCISGNLASKGSGIHTMPDATATLTNCTISGNSGNGAGGGIRNWGNMWCYSVTISENHGSVGGGFSNDGAPARMYFKNCIVAGNTSGDGIHNNGYDDFDGTGIQSQGYNIDSENSCFFTAVTDQRNTDPLLGALQNNGGPTFTHALLHGSPAIDAGTCTGAPATDQRGTPRPQGTTCDIGAYELAQASIATATSTGTAYFSTLNGYITELAALDASQTDCGPSPNFGFPHGLFSFEVVDITPGSSATIVIILPSAAPVGTQYWKCIDGVWVDCTSNLGSNDGDNVLTLTLTDGGPCDADGVANGIIVDPSGPAEVTAGAAGPGASPTLQRPLNPPQMSLQYLSITPQQTSAGQPVTITTNVVNTGDEAGNYNVTLKINGQVEEAKMVSVGPQGTQPVQFTVTKDQPGTYNVAILDKSGSFTILGAGSSGTTGSKTGGMIVLALIGVLVVASLVVLVARRRPA